MKNNHQDIYVHKSVFASVTLNNASDYRTIGLTD